MLLVMPSTLHVPIEGMSCVACAEKIQKRLKTETGVLDAAVNFATREAQITGDLNLKGVVEAVQDVGFDVPLHTQRFRIEGMHCASCVQSVEDAVAAIPGVIEAGVNLAAEDLRVRAVEAINLETVQRAVAGVGYRAIPEAEDVEVRDEALYWRRRFFMALPLAALLVLAMFREQIPSLAEV
ncbi:MAG: hypothetical protein HKN21_14750, partial [Candidatus Eisenbacteria bacterium]|nr:hypothetical protein [Candidatus Eisenbacteria bacterium]